MRPRELFSPAQSRAARGLLDWTTAELSHRSGVAHDIIRAFEHGDRALRDYERARIGSAFARAGVIAKEARHGGEGVRFKRPQRPSNVLDENLYDFLDAREADEDYDAAHAVRTACAGSPA